MTHSTPTLPLLLGLTLASTLGACATSKPSAEARAEAPGQHHAAAHASTTGDDEWVVMGKVAMTAEPEPRDDGDDRDHSSDASASATNPTTTVEYVVQPTLLDACGLTEPELYFETDSDRVDDLASIRLQRLARCLEHPALADQDIRIIGHADERGPSAYNYELGLERAESVAQVLASQGIDPERLDTESRGERRADEPEYWDDRVVLIRLSE